jgi:hypothetical protein
VNVHGTRFEEVRVGLTLETGAECVQVLDVNHDDLLTCGVDDLQLDVRLPRGGFVDRGDAVHVPSVSAVWARIEDVNRDGRPDLLVERTHRLTIQLRLPSGRFGMSSTDGGCARGSGSPSATSTGATARTCSSSRGAWTAGTSTTCSS